VLDLSQFHWISFDCYGTLIDWESGILGCLQPLLQSKGIELTDAQILSLYSEFEPREQSGDYHNYREVLAGVVRDFARELHFDVTEVEASGLAGSLCDWKAFPDTVPALSELKRRYRLAILSNIDDELFEFSAKELLVRFDCVVTAQQARSYKPSPGNFELLLERLQIPRSRLLHVAESLYHDVTPAASLGIATVWVNRRKGKAAAASKYCEAQPDIEVSNLNELVELITPHPRVH
jgi:2-haloacid dehalogenase